MKRTRILLADDHAMLLDALTNLLGQEFDVVGAARDGAAMVEMAERLQPDIIVVDISMPQLSGIEAVRTLRQNHANQAKILFLSMHTDLPLVEEAFRTGASGYVLKVGGTDELIKAIHCISRGGTYVTPFLGDLISTLLTGGSPQKHREAALTSRQLEVLRLLAEGRTMKEIGQLLNITTRTTESHKYEIMRHLGLKTTAELIRYAIRINLVDPLGVPRAELTNPADGREQSMNTLPR
jgi:DNA-binding NarL/FixJ family response regulator